LRSGDRAANQKVRELEMAIRIKSVTGKFYLAELTLPDMPAVSEGWMTPQAMHRDELIEELLKRGAHQVDVADAFFAADPDWMGE
jgi:hypothetical protein